MYVLHSIQSVHRICMPSCLADSLASVLPRRSAVPAGRCSAGRLPPPAKATLAHNVMQLVYTSNHVGWQVLIRARLVPTATAPVPATLLCLKQCTV